MSIYLAGVPGGGWSPREDELTKYWQRRLWSYFHLIDTSNQDLMQRTNKNKINLFLDSGAFSAWSQGAKIDIEEYIDFIKEHEQHLEIYANLDVISTGKTGNRESAKKTWENQMIMEDAGLSPLPVFHYGEPVEYLTRYAEKYDYISLGGMVPISNQQLVPWLDKMFGQYLTGSDHMPITKVHGFGLTSLKLMLRYPWYSVDSTSWVIAGRLGGIYVPRYRSGEWIYDENSWKVSVSNKSPDKKDSGQHISTMSPRVKSVIMDYIHEKGYRLGKSEFKRVPLDYEPKENEKWSQKKKDVDGDDRELEIIVEEGISNRYQLRDEMNIIYFLDLEKNMPEWPRPFKTKSQTNRLF